MKKYRTEILGFATLLIWFGGADAVLPGDGSSGVWELCRADDSCVIKFDYLSTQQTDPFLFLGYPMNEERSRWKQYQNGIQNYPNVRDCLITKERSRNNPNLLKIDWENVGAGSTAEVCLFRIFRSLKDIKRIQEWLEYHGFEVGENKRFWSEKYVPKFETEPISRMSAVWTVEQYREVNPSVLRNLTGFDLVLQYELILGFSAAGDFVEAQIVIPSK